MKKLFVGGLSFKTTEEGLAEAFGKAGQVISAVIITDRMTHRSKGFGFVEMTVAAEAERAIAGLNGKELDGRALNINEARPKEDRGGGGGGYRGNSGGGGGGRQKRW